MLREPTLMGTMLVLTIKSDGYECSRQVCKECFYHLFEEEIYQTIVRERMFKPGELVCIREGVDSEGVDIPCRLLHLW